MNLLYLLFVYHIFLKNFVISKCDVGTQYVGEIINLHKFSTTCSACLGYEIQGSQLRCLFESFVPCDNVVITLSYNKQPAKTCDILADFDAFGSDDFTASVFNEKYPLKTKLNICVDDVGTCKFSPTEKPKLKTNSLFF